MLSEVKVARFRGGAGILAIFEFPTPGTTYLVKSNNDDYDDDDKTLLTVFS